MRAIGVLVLGVALLVGLLACSGPQLQPDSTLRVKPVLSSHFAVAADGYRLPITESFPEQPAQALVIALHGFNDYSHAFAGMCESLLKHHIACVAYDQRGFGGSEHVGFWPQPGRMQQDLATLVQLYGARYPGLPIFLAGESMGGAVIITAMSETADWQQRVSGLILFAPAVWARSTQPWYQQFALWLTVNTVPGWTPTGRGLGRIATDNIEALRAMGRDPKVIKATRIDAVYGLTNLMDQALTNVVSLKHPTLYLYGEKDQIIPKGATCTALDNMLNAGTGFDFKLYQNGYHMLTRDLQAETVFTDVARWIVGPKSAPESVVAARVQAYCQG